MIKNELIEAEKKFRNLTFLNAELFFHQESKLHIYYCLSISHLGARGTGSFPNEAFELYNDNIDKLIQSLSLRRLNLLIELIEKNQVEK